MSQLVSTSAATLEAGWDKLRHILTHWRESSLHSKSRHTVLRAEVNLGEACDPLVWLNGQPQEVKIYWEERDGLMRFAGAGSSDEITRLDQPDYAGVSAEILDLCVHAPDNVRYFGGFRFNGNPHDDWKGFGAARFVLPLFELYASEKGTFAAVNILHHGDDALYMISRALEELDRLSHRPGKINGSEPVVRNRSDRPDHPDWLKSVNTALSGIAANRYTKIVLARESRFTLDQDVNACVLLNRLREITSFCTCFLFRFDNERVFLGASPERLFKISGCSLATEAIAGTRARGTSPDDDQARRNELLSSSKEQNEHRHVVEMISAALQPLCESITQSPAPELLSLVSGHHLATRFNGVLKKEAGCPDLLAALHPTPAVAGTPTEKALSAIHELEPFDRGWYAAPAGYIGKDAAEFIVAIRSGRLNGADLQLYSGAGIVAGSDPQKEWEEIEHKIEQFVRIFQYDAQHITKF